MPENVFLTIPDRDPNSLSGSDFVQTIMNIGPTQQREDMLLAEFINGNVPDFMRSPVEVSITLGTNTLKYNVLPDVLCIGNDNDFVRIPLAPQTAQKVANQFACMLPTKRMADQIWQTASVKMKPDANGAPYDITMQMTKAFVDHNTRVEAQRVGRLGLITGHKKDVIIDKALLVNKSCVSIYGWFYQNGTAIQGPQPNSSSHNISYKDYSHGIRMICRTATLNNQVYDLYDLLKDFNLAALISEEGAYDASGIYKS